MCSIHGKITFLLSDYISVTLTAVPRSIQLFTIHRMVELVSAYGLRNNNKRRWWMLMLAAFNGKLTAEVGWLGLRIAGHLYLVSFHQVNSRNGFDHDDRARNIIVILL